MASPIFVRLVLLAALVAALTIPLALRRTAAQGGGTAGIIDDNLVHLPTNYTTFTPPVIGGVFNDSAYGTTITRLSNGVTQFPGGDGVHHEYAVMSPFNADNTRILVAAHLQGFYVIDRSGNIVVPPANVNISHLAEPCWSTTNPNIFYFREANRLCQYNIATQTKTTIRTFNGAGCPVGTNCPSFASVRFGRGEADISEDGDHLVIMGGAVNDENIVGLYTISTNTLGPTATINGGQGIDHCDVTPNNNIICRYNTNGVCTPATTDCFKGYALWNGQTMAFIRQVMPYGAHADRGRNGAGEEVLFIAAYNDLTTPCPGSGNGVEAVKLSDGSKTCLVSLDFASEIHVSYNSNRVAGVNTNPWVLVSYTDTRTPPSNSTTSPNAQLPANWQALWGVRYNELLLLKNDGTQNRRLLHHRTRKVANDDYWFTPRAAISRDGRYAVFDSNPQALTTPDDYTDVYLADLLAPCSITTQPSNQTACLNGMATFSVVAGSGSPTYQWRKGGVDISGATGSSYTINPVLAGDVGSYDVVVGGACGTPVTSMTVTLALNNPPAITTPPANLTKCVGESATFSVVATGAGLLYQWRKNGTNISGATSSSYTLASVVAGDAGSYDVVVSGTCTPPATSAAATLTVNTPPAITVQPVSLVRAEGQPATFSVTATGALTYQWRKNGTNIGGATNSSYTIASVTFADTGLYDVVVSGTCSPATSATVTLGTLALMNAANYNSAEVAVESVVGAFGRKLANALLSATTAPLPTTLSGTTVTVRDSANTDRAAGLYFITPDQLNFLLPVGTAPGLATITINSPLGACRGFITVASVAPGLFSADSSGAGLMKGYALRTNGATQTVEQVARFDPVTCRWVAVNVNQPTNQVKLILLGTGFRNRTSLGAVTATVGGTSVTVVSADASTTTIGFDELCLQLPTLSGGSKDIAVTVDGKTANTVKVQIQ